MRAYGSLGIGFFALGLIVLCGPGTAPAQTTAGSTKAAPQTYARIGGLIYLIIIVIAFSGEAYVRGSLIVSGQK